MHARSTEAEMGKAHKLTALTVEKTKQAGLCGDAANFWLHVADTCERSAPHRVDRQFLIEIQCRPQPPFYNRSP